MVQLSKAGYLIKLNLNLRNLTLLVIVAICLVLCFQMCFTGPVRSVFMNPEVIVPGPGEETYSRKGGILDRGVFESMRKEFYELRGWDAETGVQKAETLERLGLFELELEL